MSFTDSTNTAPSPGPPPADPNQQQDPLQSPQGPQPFRPQPWPNNSLPQIANAWDPRQNQQQDPNNPNAVAPDQTVATAGFTPGSPGPFTLPTARPQGPFGPHGPAPFRMAGRQMFIPAASNQPPEMWGTPPSFPVRPPMWQIPGIYHGLGAQLAQWGPGIVQPYAAMMGQHSGAWMRGYMRGQAALSNQQYQQMRMAAFQTEQRMHDITTEYGAIFSIYGDGKHPEQLKTALRNAAQKFQDHHMLEALELGMTNAETLARYYAAKYGDLHTTNREREREEKAREALRPWVQNPTGASGVPITPETEQPAPQPPPPASGTPGATGEGKPEEQTPTPSEDEPPPEPAGITGAPQPTGTAQAVQAGPRLAAADTAGGEGPDAARPAAEGEQGAPGLGELRGLYAQASPEEQQRVVSQSRVLSNAANADLPGGRLTPESVQTIDQMAQDWAMGRLTSAQLNKLPPQIRAFVQQRYAEIASQLNGIANSNLQGRAALDAIRKVSPAAASQLESVAAGEREPPKGAALDRPPWSRNFALLKKIDPTFTPDNFYTRRKTKLDFTPGGSLGKKVVAAGTAFRLGKILEGELEKGVPGAVASGLISTGRLGEKAGKLVEPGSLERYKRITNLAREFIAEAESALAGGGAPRQTERLLQEALYDPAKEEPEAIRESLNAVTTALHSRLEELQSAYTAGTGWGGNKLLEQFSPITRGEINAIREDAAKSPANLPTPATGAVEDGYRFKGGDPRDPKNWEKQ